MQLILRFIFLVAGLEAARQDFHVHMSKIPNPSPQPNGIKHEEEEGNDYQDEGNDYKHMNFNEDENENAITALDHWASVKKGYSIFCG